MLHQQRTVREEGEATDPRAKHGQLPPNGRCVQAVFCRALTLSLGVVKIWTAVIEAVGARACQRSGCSNHTWVRVAVVEALLQHLPHMQHSVSPLMSCVQRSTASKLRAMPATSTHSATRSPSLRTWRHTRASRVSSDMHASKMCVLRDSPLRAITPT